MHYLYLLLLASVSIATHASAGQSSVGQSSVGQCSEYFFVQEGNIPVLLTSPHGAHKSRVLPHLPVREGYYKGEKVKSFVNRADSKTDKITHGINDYLKGQGLIPFVIIAGISRRQIDFNRRPTRAYEHELAIPCYQYYHQNIRDSIDTIRQRWGKGFLLDVHGQSRFPDEVIRGTRNQQTIAHLLERYGSDVTEESDGFYFVLREKNYDVQPNVGKKERYYYGGFTVKSYGSHHENGIDALQIELGRSIRMNSQRRQQVIRDVGEAIEKFYLKYYQ